MPAKLVLRSLKWLDDWAEESVVSVLLSLLVLLLGTEVFSRFLLGRSFTWIEEMCRYLFVWSSYLGIAIAIKHKEQLRVLMLMNLLEKRFPQLVRACFVLSELIFTAFCAIVFYYSISLIDNMSRFKQVSAALEIDVKYAYLIIPISMFLAAFRTLQSLYRDFKNGTLRYERRED
ncbi:TRAP transporter small permease [Desulfovibrio sp. OttesenSCG-928-G15]|nr:TRAP transporter small permease [Desulfovibrio sp. OttesenSCG-928-G15]